LAYESPLLERAGKSAQECIFVDDRSRNLDAASALGFQTLLFDRGSGQKISLHQTVQSFSDLACHLKDLS